MASTSHSKPKQKPSNKQNGSSKLRGLPKDSPEVRISKTLSYILRHGAQKEGVPMRDDGYVKVIDLIANPKLKTLTLEAINDIVKADAKQRYDLISEEEEGGQIVWLIKANQGHSLKAVQLELKPVLAASDIPSGVAVHGTDMKAWKSISTAGLSKMNRNHVHLAQGLNAMSGMRRTANVLIWIDVQKALDDGIKFWLSNNGVVLTEGNAEGVIPTAYFSKVQDSDGSLIPLPST